MSVQVVRYEVVSQASKVSNALKDNPKAAEEGDVIVREEAAAESEEAKLESEPERHTEPKVDSDLDKETVVEASTEEAAHAGVGQNKQEVDQLGEESIAELTRGSAQDATELEQKQSDKEETDVESDKEEVANNADEIVAGGGTEEDEAGDIPLTEPANVVSENALQPEQNKREQKVFEREPDKGEETLASKGMEAGRVQEESLPESLPEVGEVSTGPERRGSELESSRNDFGPEEEVTSKNSEPVPVMTTTTKISRTTIYLSCTNVVTSLKTFCEVKLQVCVSAQYIN